MGSSASTIAGGPGDRPGDRDPLPLTARQLGRPGGAARCPSPTRSSAAAARWRRSAGGYAGVQQPVGDVVQRGLVLGQEELLEHEPDPGRPQRGQVPVAQAGHVQAGDPHRAGGGPVQGAHQVQQRGLARPGRARPPPPAPRRPPQGSPRPAPAPAVTRDRSWSPGQLQHRAAAPAGAPAGQGGLRGGHGAGTTTCCPAASAGRSPAPARRRRRTSRASPAPGGGVPLAATSSTSYPPPGWASSALPAPPGRC